MKAFFRRARKGEKPGFPRVHPHRNFFYASFVHDVEEETHAHDGVLAIDVGVKTLATGVNEQGRFYHIGGFKGCYSNKQLDKIRSKRDRCEKGSKRYRHLNQVFQRVSGEKRNKHLNRAVFNDWLLYTSLRCCATNACSMGKNWPC